MTRTGDESGRGGRQDSGTSSIVGPNAEELAARRARRFVTVTTWVWLLSSQVGLLACVLSLPSLLPERLTLARILVITTAVMCVVGVGAASSLRYGARWARMVLIGMGVGSIVDVSIAVLTNDWLLLAVALARALTVILLLDRAVATTFRRR